MRPVPVHTSLHLDADLLHQLRRLADANERTVSAEARRALRRYVADEATSAPRAAA